MELRQLRYFVAVADELSFSRAAERLNISQPPISIQIKALEDELGTRLFKRTNRKIEMTHAGTIFLETARKVLDDLRRGAEMVMLSSAGKTGVIRLGYTGSVPLLDMFSSVMKSFYELCPEVTIELRHMSTSRQIQALLNDDLDVGILRPSYSFHPGPKLFTRRIWQDKLFVFMPAGHKFSNTTEPIDLSELKDEFFVCVAPDVGCGMQDCFMNLCNNSGFSPVIMQQARRMTSLPSLVSAGIGIAVLPQCYTRIGVPNVISRPLMGFGAVSDLLLTVKSGFVLPRVQSLIDIFSHTAACAAP